MRRALFALFAFVIASVFARSPAPEVSFISPCECIGFHGKNRWIAKTDLTPVPLGQSAIQSVTPSQIYAWEGLAPDVDLASMVEARIPSEEKWYALTGRIVDAKVEADGDIHLALEDATGNNRRNGPSSNSIRSKYFLISLRPFAAGLFEEMIKACAS